MGTRLFRGIVVAVVALLSLWQVCVEAEAEVEADKVLTLDQSNFTDTVSKHDFIVVEFYAPWCGHCKALAPEYEKAAVTLSSHDPPVVLAKVDASDESNRELANEFQIQSYPTIKILRSGGKYSQEYKGPRDAEGIVNYLKKQLGPASTEIKSAEDAALLIDEKSVFIVGIFPEFSGEEYQNYTILAEKLRSDYGFGHTHDTKHIPRGEPVTKPTIRLLKPFDELFVDSEDFVVESLEKFVEAATIPILTVWDSDTRNHPNVGKFFQGPGDKVMLFINFSKHQDTFQSEYKNVATVYKGKGLTFLIGDAEAAKNALQYFGFKEEHAPLLVILKSDSEKYVKQSIEVDHIAPWLKEYESGLLKPFVKSDPVPEVNDEPVKIVVRDSLDDMVFNSGKNVLLEFYAPWCGHCQKLAPILEEVATSFQNDENIVIAKFDATSNDVPRSKFEVRGYPTMYFRSASGNISHYNGDRTKEEIIKFIEENRDKPATETSVPSEPEIVEKIESGSVKDEL